MISFHCATCGEVHEGLPAFGWDYPVPYLNVPEAERDQRTQLTSDTCVIDDTQFYVRARLEIPVHGSPQPMTWGVWVSLSATNYDRFVDLLEEPGREGEGSWFGWLCSAVPCYPDTLLLKTRVHVQPVPLRPLVELEPTDHPLALDQRQGITAARAATIIAAVLHPDHRVGGEPYQQHGAARATGDSARSRTVHLVLDDIEAHGGRAAHIVREQSTRPVGATWAMVGDSLLVEQWGVMPTTDYLLHEHGGELSGRAWMEHDTANCLNGVCRGPRTSHWAIQARRIPCSEVPRDRTATLPDTLPG